MTSIESNSTGTLFIEIIFLCKKNLLDQKSVNPKSTEIENDVTQNPTLSESC